MTEGLPTDPATLIAIGVFFGVLLVFDGLRRMAGRARTTEAMAERRLKAPTSPLPDLGDELVAAAAKVRRPGPIDRLSLALDGAGIKLKPGAVVAIVIGAAVLSFSLSALLLPLALALVLTIVLSVLLPIAIIDRMRKARLEKLTQQLPDALELMARALKVGHPLNTSIEAVSREMAAPIAIEFERMVDQVTYGEDIVTAFHDLATRNRSEDFDYLAVAVGIQHGTGGNLARILEILAKVIRDRSTMRRKISAISAEGRVSAMILSVLPFAMVAITHVMSPEYYGDVADDSRFRTMAIIALVLTIANIIILRKLVSFRF